MSSLTLGEAKRHLNIPQNSMADNAELQGFIDAAETMIASRVGPLEPTTVVEHVRRSSPHVCSVVLNVTPVLSLTSATAAGVSYDVAQLDLDPAGIVRWPAWSTLGPYVVTYVAGRTSLPDDLRMAVLRLVGHLWTSQRGPGSSGRPGSEDDPTPAPGFAMPYAVAELIAPYTVLAV